MKYANLSEQYPELTELQYQEFLEDAKMLEACSKRIIELVSNRELLENQRQSINPEIITKTEQMLNIIINLLDIKYPTRPRADVFRDGYRIVTGKIGIDKT